MQLLGRRRKGMRESEERSTTHACTAEDPICIATKTALAQDGGYMLTLRRGATYTSEKRCSLNFALSTSGHSIKRDIGHLCHDEVKPPPPKQPSVEPSNPTTASIPNISLPTSAGPQIQTFANVGQTFTPMPGTVAAMKVDSVGGYAPGLTLRLTLCIIPAQN